MEGLDRDAWHRFKDGTPGQVSLCPLRGTDLFQLQALIPLEGDIDLSADGLAAMVTQRTGRNDILIRWCDLGFGLQYACTSGGSLSGRTRVPGRRCCSHSSTDRRARAQYQCTGFLQSRLEARCGPRRSPGGLLASYEDERRPIAAAMLGLSTKLLDELKKPGGMRRGRDTQQLDIGYSESALSLERPRRILGVRAGDRAPDAPIRGAAGVPRVSSNSSRVHTGLCWDMRWIARQLFRPRSGLRIHTVGAYGDIVDEGGHFRDGYGLEPGNWVLIRPDGYIGAIVSSDERPALDRYLENVGVGAAPIERRNDRC